MNKYMILCLSVMLFGLLSCKTIYQEPIIRQVHDVRVQSFGTDKIEVTVCIEVKNPNRYTLNLEKLNLDVLNKDRLRIGFATLDKEVSIPAGKSNTLDLSVKIDTRQAMKLVSGTRRSILLYISGTGRGRVKGFSKNFSFEESYDLDMMQHIQDFLPRFQAGGQDLFRIKNASIDRVKLGETTIRLEFLVLNPYGLSFSIKDFPSQIIVNDKELGKGSMQFPLVFTEDTFSRDGVLLFKLNNLKSLGMAAKGVWTGEIAYEVKGNVLINVFGTDLEKPYNLKDVFPVSISKMLMGM